MVKSMNAAIAGLKAHQTRMDVIGNNIANVNTWGYKSRSANFEDSSYANLINSSRGNSNVGGIGGVNSSQIGYGSVVSSISANFTVGSGQYTGDDMNCMIEGPAFFIVGPKAAGAIPVDGIAGTNVSLSRVGILSVDNQGYLVDGSGNYVYGFAADATTGDITDKDNLVPVQIPIDPTSTATPPERYALSSYRIGTDGTIVGVDKDSTPHTIGQIAVAFVENPNGLNQESGYLYTIGENAGRVMGMETTATTGFLKTGYLEMSNVDLASDMASMITTQRGYQANTKIITVTDEMLEQLVNMKR